MTFLILHKNNIHFIKIILLKWMKLTSIYENYESLFRSALFTMHPLFTILLFTVHPRIKVAPTTMYFKTKSRIFLSFNHFETYGIKNYEVTCLIDKFSCNILKFHYIYIIFFTYKQRKGYFSLNLTINSVVTYNLSPSLCAQWQVCLNLGDKWMILSLNIKVSHLVNTLNGNITCCYVCV